MVGAFTIRDRGHIIVFAMLSAITFFSLNYMFKGEFHSYEILSGVVTSKYKETVACEHSYSCSCDSDGNCSTCYEHFNDYDWVVKTNINDEKIKIDRVNRQGSKEPERFTNVVIGENAFIKQSYLDYFKMSKGNAIHSESIKEVAQIGIDMSHINYPDIYDYYRVNRVIFDGSSLPIDKAKLNDLMVSLNPSKQVNLVIVVVPESVDIDNYLISLRETLYGGRKNDVVLIIQSKNNAVVDARAFSRSSNKMIDETLPFSVKKIVPFDNDEFIKTISENLKEHFAREDFEQYSFMASEIEIGFKYFALYFTMLGLTSFIMLHASDRINIRNPFNRSGNGFRFKSGSGFRRNKRY